MRPVLIAIEDYTRFLPAVNSAARRRRLTAKGLKVHDMQMSVLGTELTGCCTDPMTGFFRDGTCQTGPADVGQHTVCVELTLEFLEFLKAHGNDLLTPRPEFDFPGLKPGECWCVCVESWLEAVQAKVPHRIDLGATHHSVIEYCGLETLQQHAID